MPIAAAQVATKALDIQYSSPAMINLANGLANYGEIEPALVTLWACWMKNPSRVDTYQVLLTTLQSSDEMSPQGIALLSKAFGHFFGDRLAEKRRMPLRSVEGRRIRVGYFSYDLRRHSVSYFVEPLLEHHNRDAFEVFAYSFGRSDDVTQRILSKVEYGRECPDVSPPFMEYLVLKDNLDILIDLAGHTAGNLMETVSHRLAPIQTSYIGYPHTTGIPAIDYRIVDEAIAPLGTEQEWSERLYRLPHMLCYRPDATAFDVPTTRRNSDGRIVFGSCSRLAKMNQTTWGLWADVMRAAPDATFRHKTASYNDDSCQQYTKKQFESRGVSPERIQCVQPANLHSDHLGFFRDVDVILDTVPYAGTTTTCEAMLCGVPTVTGAGNTPASRVGQSLYLAAPSNGIVVAQNNQEYIREALRLAEAREYRAELRQNGRARFLDSACCDGNRQARDLEAAYLRMVMSTIQAQSGET